MRSQGTNDSVALLRKHERREGGQGIGVGAFYGGNVGFFEVSATSHRSVVAGGFEPPTFRV